MNKREQEIKQAIEIIEKQKSIYEQAIKDIDYNLKHGFNEPKDEDDIQAYSMMEQQKIENLQVIQGLNTTLKSLKEYRFPSFIKKKIKGKSHWKNWYTDRHLEDGDVVLFDESTMQIYIISDFISLESEPDIKLIDYYDKGDTEDESK